MNVRHVLELVRLDVRFALKGLARSPTFTIAATLTLALGIGANVAMFSVLYAVVLKPLPYRTPNDLMLIQGETTVSGTRRPLPMSFRLGEFEAWQHAQTFEQPALFTRAGVAMARPDGIEQIDAAYVSSDFFQTIGGRFVAGRPLAGDDDSAPSCVISERLARRVFGSPAAAIGQSLTLTGRPYAVVGVTARDFQLPERVTDIWISARFIRSFDARDFGFQMIARRHGGTSIERLNAEVESMARRQPNAPSQVQANVVGLADRVAAPVRGTLTLLFAAAGVVLVIACINLANLLFTRDTARAREVAIRASLGASRSRLIVQALTESGCIAVLGAAAGMGVAYALVALAVGTAATFVPNLEFARIDVPTLAFAIVVMLASALLSGAAPAIASAWPIHEPRLTVVASGTPHQRVRRTLCAIEWSAALVLLVSAILLVRSLERLMTVDLGVSPDHVVTASLNLGIGKLPSEQDVVQHVNELLARIKRLPGVQAAGVGTSLPPQASRIRITLRRAGESVDYAASGVPVSPEYFSALHIPLLQGRFFNESDDEGHPPVFIMSADAAQRFFGPGDVIGRTFNVPQASWLNVRKGSAEMTLIGVIGNVKYSGLAVPPDDAIYRPFAQQPWIAPFLVMRTAVDPESMLNTIGREIAAGYPAAVVSSVKTLDSIMSDASAQPRAQAFVLIALTSLALAMAAVGLYGVVAFSVAQQTKEIGIRTALGASRARVLLTTLREGAIIAGLGLVVGLGVALAAVRLLRSSLYGVAPTDPMSFLIAASALLIVAFLASYFPSRRASAIDPLVALRHE